MLTKSVLVKGINNLSDARYCAGMGVDFVAFELSPENDNYLEPDKIKEIKNWLVGIQVGIRLTECNEVAVEIIKDLEPAFIIVSEGQFNQGQLTENVFVESESLISLPKGVRLLWHTSANDLTSLATKINGSIFIDVADGPEAIKEVLAGDFEGGLALNGGSESRPGFSDYGDLMDVLEFLDD